MLEPRFIIESELEKSEFTRAQPTEYLQVIIEDEPASALSLTAGSTVLQGRFIFETKPTARSSHNETISSIDQT